MRVFTRKLHALLANDSFSTAGEVILNLLAAPSFCHLGQRVVDSSSPARNQKASFADLATHQSQDSVALGVNQGAGKSPIGRLIEQTMQPFAAVDFHGRITCCNRAYEELTGYSLAELESKSIAELTPQQWQKSSLDVLDQLRASGKPVRYEKEYVRKDGGIVPVEVAVDLVRNDRDEAIGFHAFVTDISDRRKAADALRESEERYRQLYDEAPVGYHEINEEGCLVNINRTECEMLGYPREELLGRSIYDFLAEEQRDDARQMLGKKFDGTQPLAPLERTYVTRDGRRIIVAIEERFRRDGEGRIAGILSTVQDITERKRTEAALQGSERRARALFDGIEEAVFVHSPQGRILDANPAASRLLGYSHNEFLALSTKDIDDPEFAVGYEERLEQQLTRGHLTCEGRHRTKYGRVIPVEITSSLVQFDDDRAVLAVIRDISERKALEETRRQFAEAQIRNAQEMESKNRALTESEARYRRLTEGSLDAVVVADCQGQLVLFNPAATKVFGYTEPEIIGQSLDRLMPAPLRGPFSEAFEHYLRTRDPQIVGKTVELRGTRKNGEEFPLELSLSAVDTACGVQFICAIRDQTERHRMQALLVQQDKLASIGQLSAGLAHEINNPLSYVANNLAVLEREVKSVMELITAYESVHPALQTYAPEAFHSIEELRTELDWDYLRANLDRMLGRTREGVQRVANIVHSLRSMARTSNLQLEAVRLGDLVEATLEMVRSRLRQSNIEVVLEAAELPPVSCVPSQIGQVMLNLIINAAQSVEAKKPTDGGRIRVSTRQDGTFAILEVADNGGGIPPEVMPKLFDPFFTTKPLGEGTGLGLSISHGIVNGHGGRIEVESPPGKETCFRVLLPLKSA